ncbi:hypothetical protein [Congregibacter sp.]|uniref:hypothetical protein n=1 Tax=Congregibacter sp. TaxID=2744308 RepID=UPI003F6C6B69
MTLSALDKRNHDAEYTRRYNRRFFMHALSLLPLVVFMAVTYFRSGELIWTAVYVSGFVYLAVLLWLRGLWRRDVTAGMRREGMIGTDYRPPLL